MRTSTRRGNCCARQMSLTSFPTRRSSGLKKSNLSHLPQRCCWYARCSESCLAGLVCRGGNGMLQRFAMGLSAAGLVMSVACAQSDAGITTAVKSKLAADNDVKAYQIDVD